MMKTALATEMAPPFALVAHFFIAAVIFLVLSIATFFLMGNELSLGYLFTSPIAGLAHLYLLGFVMMIIFGAMYQLLPVVLEIPLFSKDFAYVQFYAYLIGIGMMVAGLFHDEWHLLIPYGGFMTYFSIALFCINVFLTFLRLEKNTLVSNFLLLGTIFLMASVTIGILLAFILGHGLMDIDIEAWIKAHVFGTLGGFVMMIIMGISMVLLPMFSLAHGFSARYISIALYLQPISIALAMIALIASWPHWLVSLASFLLLCSIGAYLMQMYHIFKKRVRKQNDYWVKNIFFSYICLIGSCMFVAIWSFLGDDRYLLISVQLFFFGFLLAFIVGHLYKILPFLVWYKKFSPLVGKQKVPLLHQMIHTKTADAQSLLQFCAVMLLCIGTFLGGRIFFLGGATLLLVSVVLVAFNVVYTFIYREKE